MAITLGKLSRMLGQYTASSLSSFDQLKNGFANVSYVVTTMDREKYVIKVLHTQPPESIETEIAVQAALQEKGILTPIYLRLASGEFVGNLDGYNFVISRFIEGLPPKDITKDLVCNIGKTLAGIHDALSSTHLVVRQNQAQWLNREIVRSEIDRCPLPVRHTLQVALQRSRQLFDAGLPEASIHGDLGLVNLFAKDNTIKAVFDFETLEYNIRILDICRTCLALACEGELEVEELLEILCEGYDSQAKQALLVSERNNFGLALKYTATACGAWDVNFSGNATYANKLQRITATLQRGTFN